MLGGAQGQAPVCKARLYSCPGVSSYWQESRAEELEGHVGRSCPAPVTATSRREVTARAVVLAGAAYGTARGMDSRSWLKTGKGSYPDVQITGLRPSWRATKRGRGPSGEGGREENLNWLLLWHRPKLPSSRVKACSSQGKELGSRPGDGRRGPAALRPF